MAGLEDYCVCTACLNTHPRGRPPNIAPQGPCSGFTIGEYMSLGCYCSLVIMNSMTRSAFTYNRHSSICSMKYPPMPNSAKQQSDCYCCNCKGAVAGQNGYCPWTSAKGGLVYAVPNYLLGMSASLYTDIVDNIIHNKAPSLTGGGPILSQNLPLLTDKDFEDAIKSDHCICDSCIKSHGCLGRLPGTGQRPSTCMGVYISHFVNVQCHCIVSMSNIFNSKKSPPCGCVPGQNIPSQSSNCFCNRCHGRPALSQCPEQRSATGQYGEPVPSYLSGLNSRLFSFIIDKIYDNLQKAAAAHAQNTSGHKKSDSFESKHSRNIYFSCDKCNTFNEYAEPNMPGNIYRCYSCRNR